MSFKLTAARIAVAAAVTAATLSAAPARAATIVLSNIGGVTPGTAAYDDFRKAANFWGQQITNNATIRIDVGFGHLGTNILGQTQINDTIELTQDVYHQLATTGVSSIDATAVAHLSPLTPSQFGPGADGVNMITPGYTDAANRTGVDTSTQIFDHDGSANNAALDISTANAKALGLLGDDGKTADASIAFSSDFAFDFDPSNGVGAKQIDFLGVAIHEIGHALGFDSGVDTYDVLGYPKGPLAGQDCGAPGMPSPCDSLPLNDDFAIGSTLDLFRYSAPGTLNWAPGAPSYFSIDGGVSNGCDFSTGAFNGDTWQASHWQRRAGNACGIMDPAVSFGQEDAVSNLDFTAFDAIGYNFTFDPGLTPTSVTTGEIFQQFGVPEPGVWSLMILGFGMAGAAMRRRRGLVAA